MSLKIKQLHPIFGAEVTGVDLASEMNDAVFSEIRDAFEEHSVLVFRDQKVDDDQQIAFSKKFGPLERMLIGSQGAGTPIAYLSNVDRETGEIIEPDDKRMVRNACNMLWHSDSSFKRVPALGSILSGREVPEDGGETEYASMRAAYDTLPEDMKRRIDGLVAEHSFDYSRSLVDSTLLDNEQRNEVPPVPQRLVVQNPQNGRKALYVGSHASHVIGMPVDEGRALIRELLDHATQSQFVYRHRWRQNEIVMWDNRAVVHRGRPWDFRAGRRIMHRTTLAGALPTVEQPFEAYSGAG